MRIAITALVFLFGLFDLFLAASFLFDPVTNGAALGVKPDGIAGISTIRADFTAFFLVAGAGMLWGAWRRKGDLLLAPAALFGIAFIGRAIDLAVNGAYPMWWQPMTVEALESVLALAAWRVLPHHKIEEIAG